MGVHFQSIIDKNREFHINSSSHEEIRDRFINEVTEVNLGVRFPSFEVDIYT